MKVETDFIEKKKLLNNIIKKLINKNEEEKINFLINFLYINENEAINLLELSKENS